MNTLKESYTSFLKDIEANIKNKEDLLYVKARFAKFLDVVLEEMDHIMEYRKQEVEELEKKQKELDEKMEKMEQIVSHIEQDIYSEDGFDFEIVCPYCNYEFVIDVDEEKTEIECPECHNMIELDWTGDLEEGESGCLGSCSSCQGCAQDEEEEDDIEEKDDKEEAQDVDEDDDM